MKNKRTARLLVGAMLLVSLSGLTGCGADTPTPTKQPRSEVSYTQDQLKDLASRVATVASIRYTGYGESEAETLNTTISGELKDTMDAAFTEAFTNRFIPLQDKIDAAYFDYYDSHYSEWADENTITYKEWLKTEEAEQIGVMDGRIVEHEGQLGVWAHEVQVQPDGSATVVICNVPTKIEVGQASSITKMLGDHGYDFQVLSWGYFNDGEMLVKVGTKAYTPPDFEYTDDGHDHEAPDIDYSTGLDGQDTDSVRGSLPNPEDSDYSSGTYTILLKGAVEESEDGTLTFIPTPESYVWLVKELNS